MIVFIISAIKIIILLGFLIFIHELGHFIAAKLSKVKVNEFAIGFGPTIWKKQGKETKYALRLLPLGGFVSMEGEEERSEENNSFSKASIPKRIVICMAGAIVNIIFALVVYFCLMASTDTYVSNEIDTTLNDYVASQLGFQNGDKIIEINNSKINSKYDLDKILQDIKDEEINIKIQRNEDILEYKTKLTEVKMKSTGMYLSENAKIVMVEKGSSSEKQGIKANDVILKVNNQDIYGDAKKVLELIQNKENENVNLTIKRGNEEITIDLIPDNISKYYLGTTFKKAEDSFGNRCIYAGIETKEFVFSIFDNLKSLFTGNVGLDQMMGPVGISEMVAKTDGWYEFIYLLSLISLSLGVTNLLPIPALDGGKILILIIEAIRRKPMNQKTEINIQLLGFSILIALSIYVAYNDVLRLF